MVGATKTQMLSLLESLESKSQPKQSKAGAKCK